MLCLRRNWGRYDARPQWTAQRINDHFSILPTLPVPAAFHLHCKSPLLWLSRFTVQQTRQNLFKATEAHHPASLSTCENR